jgi:hypothetical protein
VTQQQQQPNILPPEVQAAWDTWCDARIDSQLDSFTDLMAEEVGATEGRHAQKIFELLEIVQVLAVGNEFLRGRIDQITREFKHQNGVEHKQAGRTIERTIATTTEEEHTSRVSQTLSIIDEVLHGSQSSDPSNCKTLGVF